MSMVRCIKLELEEGSNYLVDRIEGDDWRTEIMVSELDEVFRVEIIEMDENELKEMPEFDGF